jgi:hypothetical protein
MRHARICLACDDRGSKPVIGGLNPQHPMLRLFKPRRWQLNGQRFIFSHEGCRCLHRGPPHGRRGVATRFSGQAIGNWGEHRSPAGSIAARSSRLISKEVLSGQYRT